MGGLCPLCLALANPICQLPQVNGLHAAPPVDTDPHFIIHVPYKEDALCFNINEQPGVILNLVQDPNTGLYWPSPVFSTSGWVAPAGTPAHAWEGLTFSLRFCCRCLEILCSAVALALALNQHDGAEPQVHHQLLALLIPVQASAGHLPGRMPLRGQDSLCFHHVSGRERTTGRYGLLWPLLAWRLAMLG